MRKVSMWEACGFIKHINKISHKNEKASQITTNIISNSPTNAMLPIETRAEKDVTYSMLVISFIHFFN